MYNSYSNFCKNHLDTYKTQRRKYLKNAQEQDSENRVLHETATETPFHAKFKAYKDFLYFCD